MSMRRSRVPTAMVTLGLLAACSAPEQKAPEPPATVAASLAPAPPPSVATPPPTTAAPATTMAPKASAAPPVTTAPKAAPSKAPAAPTAAPPPTTAAHDHTLRVASILTSAQAALSAGKLKEAAVLFDDALALDPDNAAARKGKAFVSTTLLGQVRSFVPDLASSEGAEGKLKKMEGFDDVEERDVRRAVKVPGRAELDSSPAHIKPGEPYKVDIFIRNLSTKKKKNIKISNINVKRIVNEKEVRVPVEWKAAMVEPRQRAHVATVTGNWEDDVSSWILEVKLLAEETNDIYENRVVWK